MFDVMASVANLLEYKKPAPRITDLERALAVAARLIERYSATPLEEDAISIFERLESELNALTKRQATKERARHWLRYGSFQN